MARPVDGMFRAGQISSKEWARLSMTANGKGGKTKGKMAPFEQKTKDEGTVGQNRSVAGTGSRHINGPKQGMGTAAKGAGSPSRAGGVHGNNSSTTSRAINEKQKPNFPGQGPGRARKTYSAQQPASTNSSHMGKDSMYGGPSRRAEKPMRLSKVQTGGAKF
jgi:hypothetical protein